MSAMSSQLDRKARNQQYENFETNPSPKSATPPVCLCTTST
jgi:hypothetical protein